MNTEKEQDNLNILLVSYEKSWETETEILLDYLARKKQELEKVSSLYEAHLKCNLLYEQPDSYKFSFLNDDSSVRGWIRFQHDQVKNKWSVLEIQPSNVVPQSIIDQFCELQDTQGFLYYFKSRI